MKPMNCGAFKSANDTHITAATPSTTAYCVSESPIANTATRRTLKRKFRWVTSRNLPLLVLGAVEQLYDALTVKRFFGDARDVAHRVLYTRAVAAKRTTHRADDQSDDWADDGDQQRELAGSDAA